MKDKNFLVVAGIIAREKWNVEPDVNIVFRDRPEPFLSEKRVELKKEDLLTVSYPKPPCDMIRFEHWQTGEKYFWMGYGPLSKTLAICLWEEEYSFDLDRERTFIRPGQFR